MCIYSKSWKARKDYLETLETSETAKKLSFCNKLKFSNPYSNPRPKTFDVLLNQII